MALFDVSKSGLDADLGGLLPPAGPRNLPEIRFGKDFAEYEVFDPIGGKLRSIRYEPDLASRPDRSRLLPFQIEERSQALNAPPFFAPAQGEFVQPGTIDLRAEWVGDYNRHFNQCVRTYQFGTVVIGVKVTGDDHIQANEITFWFDLKNMSARHPQGSNKRASCRGFGQIAEREGRNQQFVPGAAALNLPDRFIFTWVNYGKAEFRWDGSVDKNTTNY